MTRVLLFIAAFFLAFGAGAKVLVISDIDDTIRSINRYADYWTQFNHASDMRRAFSGLSPLYQSLDRSGSEIHYVTAAVYPLTDMSKGFLKENSFPQPRNFHAKGWFDDKADFKQAAIEKIIRVSAADHVLLIGDNGEKDIEAYGRIAAQFPNVHVFIHKLFEGPPAPAVPEDQYLFITGADLAAQLEALGFVSSQDARRVIDVVVVDAVSADSFVRSLVLPDWAEITEHDAERAFGYVQASPETMGKLLLVESALFGATPVAVGQ